MFLLVVRAFQDGCWDILSGGILAQVNNPILVPRNGLGPFFNVTLSKHC